jgi:hypothetical protein
MSDDDDDRSQGQDSSDDEDDALTQELKRIDAESDAVEVEFEAENGVVEVRDDEEEELRGLIWAVPGLARMMVKAWLRTVTWGGRTSVRVTLRLGHAAVDPRATVALVRDVSSGVRVYAREFLGISDLEQRVEQADPGRRSGSSGPVSPVDAGRRALARRRRDGDEPPPPPEVSLRVRGAQLLRQSADVSADDSTHPAYGRILAELAPDEGRILRLLAAEGPQPTVDVRALNLIGVGSQLVESDLSMIGSEAGCRHVERLPEYLINLQRLGLVEFADDPVDDPSRYQVVEAQPDVLGAIKRASRAKTVHRSLRLTPFGQKFCDVCLPLDRDEVEELTDD